MENILRSLTKRRVSQGGNFRKDLFYFNKMKSEEMEKTGAKNMSCLTGWVYDELKNGSHLESFLLSELGKYTWSYRLITPSHWF
jgi:hypothetical protein